MRIACPNCNATYEVPDTLIGGGRTLRCAKCGHDWLATGRSAARPEGARDPAPEPREPVTDDAPPPTPALRRPPQVIDPPLPQPGSDFASRRALVALWAAWIASGLLLVGFGAVAWAYRGPIVDAWPPAARLYSLFGDARNG